MYIISVQSSIVNLHLSYNHITNIYLTRSSLAVNNLLPRWICISGTQSTSDTSHAMQAVLIDDAPFWNLTLKPILIISDWYVTARSSGHIFIHNGNFLIGNLLSEIRKYYLPTSQYIFLLGTALRKMASSLRGNVLHFG